MLANGNSICKLQEHLFLSSARKLNAYFTRTAALVSKTWILFWSAVLFWLEPCAPWRWTRWSFHCQILPPAASFSWFSETSAVEQLLWYRYHCNSQAVQHQGHEYRVDIPTDWSPINQWGWPSSILTNFSWREPTLHQDDQNLGKHSSVEDTVKFRQLMLCQKTHQSCFRSSSGIPLCSGTDSSCQIFLMRFAYLRKDPKLCKLSQNTSPAKASTCAKCLFLAAADLGEPGNKFDLQLLIMPMLCQQMAGWQRAH